MLVSLSGHAEGLGRSNLYLGIGASGASIDDGRVDDTTMSSNLRLGYHFGNLWGAELGYYDLGRFGSDEISMDAEAYSAALVINLPLTVVDLYGKLGAVRVDAGVNTRGPFGLLRDQDESTQPFAVIGAEYDLGTINLFGEYSRIGNDFGLDLDVFSAGIKLEF